MMHPTPAGSSHPGAPWSVPLWRTSLIAAAAILGGILAAIVALRSAALDDPAGVVGVPLLRGYSERLEQGSFYAFVLATLALAGILSKRGTAGRVPIAVLVPAGAMAMLVPPCLPAWCAWPRSLPGATACGALAFLVGSAWDGRGWRSAGAWVVGLFVWGLGFPELPVILLSRWQYIGAAALAVGAFRWCYPRLPGTLRGEQADWRHALAGLLVICGTSIANDREFRLAALGAVGFFLGRRAGSKRGECPALGSPAWIAYVACLGGSFSLDHQWSILGPVKTALAVAGGAGGAAVLSRAIPSRRPSRLGAIGASVRWGRWVPLLAIGGIALTAVARPWFGGAITAAALAIAGTRPRRSWGWLGAFTLAGALMLAILPGPPVAAIDHFHDGQILSAVWEFESGRPLFAEVFPLRSFEFFLTWIARRVAEPSLANYFIANRLFDALPIAAVCLLAFAWTRSLAWSLATALAAATAPVLGSRMGVPLLFAALGVAVFRARSRLGLAWLASGGWLAALLGFDVLIPLVGASVLTILIAGPPGRVPRVKGMHSGPLSPWERVGVRAGLHPPEPLPSPQPSPRERGGRMQSAVLDVGASLASGLPGRIGWAALLLVATFVPFLAALALGQGYRAAGAYCWLLAENARNLPAFYGLPLPWDAVEQRLLMTSGLAVVGTWAAVGAAAWPALGAARRRTWAFLLVSYVLIAHRGLGRSDPAHLSILVPWNLVLTSLALFEGLRFLAHRGLRSPLTDRRALAFAAMAAACWLSPVGGVSPHDVQQWVRAVPGRVGPEPSRSALVLERVGPRDYLWEMEGAMMNYAHRRHNPTRHALAYCISSPGEQRAAVAALRARPPQLVAWQYVSGSNGIPNPLRFYVISQHLYRHFRPIAAGGGAFLEPAPPGWPGQIDLAPPFIGALPLGQLALRWGRDRIPELSADPLKRQALGPWVAQDRGGTGRTGAAPPLARTWEARGPIDSRTLNYLRLDLSCRAAGAPPARAVEAVLEFAPSGRDYDETARVSFAVIPDGVARPCLIPIGCSPAWSWRPRIDRMRVTIPVGHLLSPPRAECWQIDEVGAGSIPAGGIWPMSTGPSSGTSLTAPARDRARAPRASVRRNSRLPAARDLLAHPDAEGAHQARLVHLGPSLQAADDLRRGEEGEMPAAMRHLAPAGTRDKSDPESAPRASPVGSRATASSALHRGAAASSARSGAAGAARSGRVRLDAGPECRTIPPTPRPGSGAGRPAPGRRAPAGRRTCRA